MTNTTTTTASVDEIEARIAAERDRIQIEERREVDLTERRLIPLEAGDDKGLDEIERGIDESRIAQLRIQERIELLEKRLVEAREAAKQAEIDRIAQHASSLFDQLSEVMAEYGKHASAAAKSLGRIAAIDAAIARLNRELERSGRKCKDSSALRIGEAQIIPAQTIRTPARQNTTVRYGQGHEGRHGAMVSGDGRRIGDPSPEPEYITRHEPEKKIPGKPFPVVTKVAVIPSAGPSADLWNTHSAPDEAEVARLARVPDEPKGVVGKVAAALGMTLKKELQA